MLLVGSDFACNVIILPLFFFFNAFFVLSKYKVNLLISTLALERAVVNLWKDFIIAIIITLLLDALFSQMLLFVLIHISVDFFLFTFV